MHAAAFLGNEVAQSELVQRFYRAFVFTIVAGCTDAHAKNHSLMLDGASVGLAPLYELSSFAVYWDGEARLDSDDLMRGLRRLPRIKA